MRALVPFALALAGTVAFTTDASAFGRRRAAAAAASSSGGCNGGGYASNYGGCYGSGAYSSGGCSGSGYGAYSSGGCYGSGYGSVMSSGCYGSGYASSGYGSCYGSRSAGYSAGYGGYSAGSCSGSGYVQSGYGYSGSGYTQSGYSYSGSVAYSNSGGYSVTYSNGSYSSPWVPMTTTGGQATVFQATDGAFYALGADGVYRPASSNGTMMYNGTAMPYAGATTFSSSSYTPAGSATTTTSSGVIQASGTAPLSMPGTTFRAKQMLGTQILLGNNTQVGTVEDLVTDGSGNLDYVIVSAGDGKLVTVPWDAAKFDADKKTATINVTQEVWKTVPTYTTTTYPQFYTPTYRTDIYKAYGLTPRERRIP